jgi:hypothetical protein
MESLTFVFGQKSIDEFEKGDPNLRDVRLQRGKSLIQLKTKETGM